MSARLQPYIAASGPRIRAMQEADIPQVQAIEARAYDFPWTQGVFRDCVRSGYGCWVLQLNDSIIGYGIISCAANECHVMNVCIAPEFQGSGHGRHLMARLLDLARYHRSERIFLEVRPSNPRAITLYHSMGFNEIGRRPRYYPSHGGREDAVVMGLELFYDEP